MARAFLRAMADDPALEVPSPTFTLVQSYELRIPVSHFDLYRLADVSELDELGFDEALSEGICLVEWPENALSVLPKSRLTATFSHLGDGRTVTITGEAAALARIERSLAIRAFLKQHGHGHAKRRHLSGDASARAYERILTPGEPVRILMDLGPSQARPHPSGRQILSAARPYRRRCDPFCRRRPRHSG